MENDLSTNEIYLIIFIGTSIMFFLALAFVIFFNRSQRKVLEQKKRELFKERQLTERLQQIDKLKDQFLANTSHELRTPLQGIIGISEYLFDESEKIRPEELRENLSMTIASGKRLNSLVNDLLDFSKLKNNDIELHCRPVSLKILADIVLRNSSPLARGKKLTLSNEITEGLSTVYGDEDRLQQILYNLIGNAIKFTEEGFVKVGAEEFTKDDLRFTITENNPEIVNQNSEIVIRVEDTGIGIPEDKREAIFLEFEQADSSISREFIGTGLGLSISRKLVELHGGRLWVESELGKGSIFYFSLPVSGQPVTKTPAASAARGSEEPIFSSEPEPTQLPFHSNVETETEHQTNVHILIVDDEPINQKVLRNHLSHENYHLTQVMNGEQALRAIQQHPDFDLVILDIMMPRISGYEVCEKIRRKYLPSELPVIMVTAKNQVEDLVQGFAQGANDYLAKPFTKEEFLARVKTQLELHHINSVTSKFVPIEFLQSLGRERITEVMLGDHTEREVTVLFSDIRDYTTLAETMTPEDNFRFVNAFYGRMGPIIHKNGGIVNQYLGDAVMAIFPNRPENALQAAIDMQKQLMDYNRERIQSGRQMLKIGIGLHSGPLIMGIIGDQKRMDAATISDTVNTASRIESLTKYFNVSILMSEDSLDKIETKDAFRWRYLGKVLVKGKKNPVGVYDCFGGDAPDIKAHKIKTVATFEEGLNHFYDRNFREAIHCFEAVLESNPKDQVAYLFHQKSTRHLREGISADWTGIEVLTFK